MGRSMVSASQGRSEDGPQKDAWHKFSDNHCDFLPGSLLTPGAFLGGMAVSGSQFLRPIPLQTAVTLGRELYLGH